MLTCLARGLLALAPLRLTLWILVGATAVIVVLIAILIARHGESARADRRGERVRGELGPLLSMFFQTEGQVRLAEELRPAFLRMNAAEGPAAAALITKGFGSFDDPTTGETLGERVEDEDREIATGAAETLVALTRRPHAAPAAGARLERCSARAVEYARKVAEVSA